MTRNRYMQLGWLGVLLWCTVVWCAVFMLAGCAWLDEDGSYPVPSSMQRSPSAFSAPSARNNPLSSPVSSTQFPVSAAASAVVAGLTRVDPAAYRGWAGECPGSDVDASVFALMCEQEGVPVVRLANAQATRKGIELYARQAAASLAPGGLLILYYSGHGGQLRDASGGDEPDGQDETICLWDGQLRDDDVWNLLQKLPDGIRVWMVTDSCHSGTNYRGVHDYAGGIAARASRTDGEGAALSLLHWGGCGDGQFSYGSEQGGSFTTALVDAWERGQSYAAWFDKAKSVCDRKQIPTCAILGSADQWRLLPAFK